MEGIRKHYIFTSDTKFWETCILYKNLTMKINPDTKKTQNVFQAGIVRNILAVAYHMNDIFKEKEILKGVCFKYIQDYKISEPICSDLIAYLQSVGKTEKSNR